MNKVWYTTIFLAIAVVVVGVLFFFVLPRNSLKDDQPIAMMEDNEEEFFKDNELEEDAGFEDYDSYDESEFDEWLNNTEEDLSQQFEEELSQPEQEIGQPIEVVQPLSNNTNNVPMTPPTQQLINETVEEEDLGESIDGRRQTAKHRVIPGEWLAQITNKYWGDFFLWPDLYKLNTLQSGDPDLIYPGEIVKVYESLVEDGLLDYEDKKILISAYLDVYQIYKKMGTRKNQSVWRLLYSATRYEPNFLEMYKDDIDEEDRKMAIKLVEESKYID